MLSTRKDLWRYLGFKHVNGPSTWGSYAKAKYIATVHNDFGVSLQEIAQQIGDYNNTVERQYHGLMVVEQAERAKAFNRETVARRKGFEFSHIYEGLNREGIQKFLGLTKEARSQVNPVPKNKIKELGELLLWIYGDEAKGISPRMGTQAKDLEKLTSTLSSEDGIRALRDGLSLELAHNAALGDEQLFKRALNRAKQELQDATGLVTTGFNPNLDTHSMTLANDVEHIATALVDAMQTKKRKRPQRKG